MKSRLTVLATIVIVVGVYATIGIAIPDIEDGIERLRGLLTIPTQAPVASGIRIATRTPMPAPILSAYPPTPAATAPLTPIATLTRGPTPIDPILAPGLAAPFATLTPPTNVLAHGATVRLTTSRDTVYYLVTGATTQEIFDSLEANGPDTGQELGERFTSGLAEAESSYQIELLDDGESCEVQSVAINLKLVVTLPQHSNPSSLSNLQLRRWRQYVRQVATHEQHHVDIHYQTVMRSRHV